MSDEDESRKAERDRVLYGTGDLRENPDGTLDHIAIECVGPRVSKALKLRATRLTK